MKSLDYSEIRKGVVTDISASPVFKDYNFDAAGISALMDVLAKNDHKMGYIAKMMLDESFRDTAHTFAALTSHAKSFGAYIRGKSSASCLLSIEALAPAGYAFSEMQIYAGQRFAAANASQDTRVFTALAPATLTKSRVDQQGQWFAGVIRVNEGSIQEKTYSKSSSLVAPTYTITDLGCDASTLTVSTRPAGSTQAFTLAKRGMTPADVRSEGVVWWPSLDSMARRVIRLAFGSTGLEIKARWLSTTGSLGNGAREFVLTKVTAQSSTDINNATQVVCKTDRASMGGADLMEIDEIRDAIASQYRRQGRVQSPEDVAAYIKENFGDWAAVQAWGGELEGKRLYGKTVVCVVPKTSRVLSTAARQDILRLLDLVGMPGDQISFVDAKSQDLRVFVSAKASPGVVSKESLAVTLKTAIEDWFGPTRARLDVSAFTIQEVIKSLDVVSAGVKFEFSTDKGPGEGSVNYGVPIAALPSPGLSVTQIDSQTLGWKGSGVLRAEPSISDFAAPKQSFFSLIECSVEVV